MKAEQHWQVDGRVVEVKHLDKIFWPRDGLTKGDMLTYYREMGRVMVPYFRDRPVTLRIFPDGIHGFSFYRRDAPERAPSWIRQVDYKPKTAARVIQLPLVDDVAGLIWLANKGSIEFHLWASRWPHLEQPDWAVFDLDVGRGVSFGMVLEAALALREYLQARQMDGYCKTSGGHGLHVYVPLTPGYTFEQVRAWAYSVAVHLSQAHPQLIAVPHGSTHKSKRVTIDYAQNSIGRNTAAPYTLRARLGAPVSTPLTWEEVEHGRFRPSDFNIHTVPPRVRELGDPFADLLRVQYHISE